MSVPNFYVKKRSKNCHWKWSYWKAAQNVSAKKVSQNVHTEILAELAFEKLSPKWPHWNAAHQFIRKTNCSKCPSQNVSWKSVRNNYHLKLPYWNAAEKSSSKTVDQNVRTEILAERAFKKLSRKLTYWNAAQNCIHKTGCSKCPYRNASWKSVRKNNHWKLPRWDAPKIVSFRKNSCSNCP